MAASASISPTAAVAGARSPTPLDTTGSSGSPAAVGTLSDRLTEAVERVAESLTRGAAQFGHVLPAGFALERARNIVAGLIDLFDPEAFR
jgi:hypothetical protein